jgi:N-acetylated-alpha-linked acidic dipeptidase
MMNAQMVTKCIMCPILLAALAPLSLAQTPASPPTAPLAEFINTAPSADQLREWHGLLASEPHIAGTAQDERTIARLRQAFASMGLDVTTHEFWAYLCKPIDARVAIVSPTGTIDLPVREDALAEDSYSRDADNALGFNAYSGNGDVTAHIVYANYGTKDDFGTLRELGIDCSGKIVLARYGGNFRGYKAKFAEAAGAVGLIIYSDPDDVGYRKGVMYPEGGWANDSYLQRGTIITLAYPGDPLTPGIAATETAQRLDPATLALPRIPVQPVGYGAAREIMMRMKGAPLPANFIESWQGGIPCTYRLTGGPELKVRIMVKQQREVMKSANVIATIPGEVWPEQKVIIGCHHDAWCHGAGDPLSGTILVLEAARSFAEAARRGLKPARTLVFATWGAEEFGIIGSTEYCEQFADDLRTNAVAYINLDAATMGTQFSSSASPSLKRVIDEVVALVPQARSSNGETVRKAWLGDRDEPDFGNLGGGSDHIGFYCHLGIPSCGLSAGGAPGTAYHSIYDNLAWYRNVVGDDYQPALMLTRVVNLLAMRLACDPLLPLDPACYTADMRTHLDSLQKRAGELNFTFDCAPLHARLDAVDPHARRTAEALRNAEPRTLEPEAIAAINAELVQLERCWIDPQGLPERPWFRNLFAASDPDSGYSAWMLPALRWVIEQRVADQVELTLQRYIKVLTDLDNHLTALDAALSTDSGTP